MAYHEAAKILKETSEKKRSVKSLVLSSSHKNKKELLAIVCESLKYTSIIEDILEATKLTQREKILKGDKWLTVVLLYDFLFSKGGLKQCNKKLKEAFTRNKSALTSALVRIKVKEKAVTNNDLIKDKTGVTLPRYVRVNLLRTTVENVITSFQNGGYELLERPTSHQDFLSKIEGLQKKQFVQDVFMNDLLVFGQTDFHDHPLYFNGHVILQDKASCIPAHVLHPPPGACVLDACAAPGNKTSQACAYMENNGTMYAFDLDPRRLATMKKLLTKAGVTCARLENRDFLTVEHAKYHDVEYAIVDPSCSGSGIVNRLGQFTDDSASESAERLEALAKFQVSVVSHALSFPNVKRVVYSTCSIHKEENEMVVKTVMDNFKDRFVLREVLPAWPSRGLAEVFPQATACLRLNPSTDKTNGFFVACFERKGWNGDVVEKKKQSGDKVEKHGLEEDIVERKVGTGGIMNNQKHNGNNQANSEKKGLKRASVDGEMKGNKPNPKKKKKKTKKPEIVTKTSHDLNSDAKKKKRKNKRNKTAVTA